jgi:hypothetical protein
LLVVALTVRTAADVDDAPPVRSGLVLFGSIVPALTLLPVTSDMGVPANFPSGRDSVTGYDTRGRRLFRHTFRDNIYSYYLFVQLDAARARDLYCVKVEIAGRTIERRATVHGGPAARARSVGPQRVRITWDARAFPRLSCRDEGGGSPAPLMLGGDFTAADVRGVTVRCDFSDGVKTAYAGVRVPIQAASPNN